MSNIEKKEKNLNQLIDKLDSLSLSYSQPNYEIEKIRSEKNEELLREHKYLKEKIKNLQLEVNKKSEIEDKFNQEIDELSQETENLVSEIDKWQM